MHQLFPEIEPYANGMLDVGDGNQVYWECCGNPAGKPALVLHGGPGSGCSAWHRRLFNPDVYRVVLFDQRNCGRSRPHASELKVNLDHNNTSNLVKDIEQLRQLLSIEEWLVLGGSWGSTLALAYAESHASYVTEMILFGVTTGLHREFDWLFRGGLAILFPSEWHRLRSWLPSSTVPEDIVDAYHRMLTVDELSICHAAAFEWCLWESATPEWPPKGGFATRFKDPGYRLAFSRIVTHFVRNNAWLEDGILLRHSDRLTHIPGFLISGRFDLQAPIASAWELKQTWQNAELIIVNDAGHSANDLIANEVVSVTNRLAGDHPVSLEPIA